MSSKPTRFGIKNQFTSIIFTARMGVACSLPTVAPEVGNMKLINVKNIGGALLGLLLLFGAVMMSGTTAQAQYWPNQDQSRRQRDYERAQRERQAQIERERQAQQAQNGRWDNRNNPGRRGRPGDGYRNYGGSYELRQTALNAGYNEGVKAGRNDRRHNRYDFRDDGAYQKATKDYNSRYGDRYAYQRYFRDAFENGYSDGYYGY
jgi:hypothetical protein